VNIVITLDYELFFGSRSGTAQTSLIEPAQALADLARRHRVPLVFFVDAAWLVRMREQTRKHPSLMAEHYRVAKQLEQFAIAGHELQLHVHPHWQDSQWHGDGWSHRLDRYRLHDYSELEIRHIVSDCSATLRSLSAGQPVTAFRAGGWCIQPFDRLRPALSACGIRIDSTVFAGGRQDGPGQRYDFSTAPALSRWRFDSDPLVPSDAGAFLEVPIASHRVSPRFYWHLALAKKLRLGQHRALGEGEAMHPSRNDLLKKLLQPTVSVVSIDGLKASFLEAAYQSYKRRHMQDFVIIGHPKAFTPYSLDKLDAFLQNHQDDRFVGLNHYLPQCKPSRDALVQLVQPKAQRRA
jgi:hypothetical protein